MKIVSLKICPFVQRVTALLAAKNIPYEIEYISLREKPDWFLEVSPHGQVPLLITDSGISLFESDAIVEYLDEIYPPLEQNITPEQKALDRAWSYMATKHYLTQCSAMRSSNYEQLQQRTEKLNQIFNKAEAMLTSGPFFKGEQLGNIDIAWLPLLHRASIVMAHADYNFLKNYPKVQTWQGALMSTNLATDSVAEDFEQRFAEFYLSEQTYLGCGANCTQYSVDKGSKKTGCCG